MPDVSLRYEMFHKKYLRDIQPRWGNFLGERGASEVAQIVLEVDPVKEPERAKRMWASHLARAQWMTEVGYRHLLQGGSKH